MRKTVDPREKRPGWIRRFFTLLPVQILLVLLLAVLADSVVWLLSTASIQYVQEGEIRLLDLEKGRFKNSTLEDGYYSAGESTPQIKLRAPEDMPVGGVIIHLSQPLEQDTVIRLYYTKEGEKQTSDNSEKIIAYAGLTELPINIPADMYRYLNFRIRGNMYLDRISVSESAVVQRIRPWSFNWIRILAVFAPLLAAICLYRYSNGFRGAVQTFDRKVIQPETRWKAISYGYGIFACAMILSNVYRMLYWKKGLSYTPGAFPFEIPWYVFAILGILLGRMWKTRTFWVLLILLAWQYFRLAFEDYAATVSVRYFFLNSLYLYFGCFSVGRALPPAKNRWFIGLVCITWTLMMLVYEGFGAYAAWNGVAVPNLGGSTFAVRDSRLYGIYHPVICGVLAGVSCALLITGMHITRRKSVRMMGILAFMFILIIGSLSVARTGYVVVGFALASTAGLHLYERLFSNRRVVPLKDGRIPFGGKVWRWTAVCLLFMGILVSVTLLQNRIVSTFTFIRDNGGFFPRAVAEAVEGAKVSIAPREFNLDSPDAFLTERITIWEIFSQVLKENPSIRLWGQSVYNTIAPVNELSDSLGFKEVAHCHNELFQNILESGIPGGVLYLIFVVSILIATVKVVMERSSPLWFRMIPLASVCCLIAETVDCTCKISTMHPQATLLYLFAGLTLAASEQTIKKQRRRRSV